MKKSIAILISLIILSVNNLSADTNTYRIKVDEFTKLKVYDNINLIYKCNPDSAGYAVWSGDNKSADTFIFSNNKGTLKVQNCNADKEEGTPPSLVVYSRFLTEIESSSTQTVFIADPMATPHIKCRLVGNGKIVLSNVQVNSIDLNLSTGCGTIVATGKCDNTKIKIVGTGTIQTDELESKIVECLILGTGSIGCNPSELLKVKGIGTTKVYYKGSPEIKKSGGGTLISIDQENSNSNNAENT